MTTVHRFAVALLIGLPMTAWANGEEASEAEASGITPSLSYIVEYRENLDGGLERGGTWLDQLTLALDGGETWHVSLLATTDNVFSERYSGDFQAVSNVEGGHNLRIYEAWYQWRIGQARLLAGLFDFNSEFDAIETGGLFTHSSHGIGAEFAQSGERGPSIFPHASFALRLDGGSDNFAWRIAAFDAVPGDPNDEGRTAIHLGGGDGALLVGEIERPGVTRWVLGAWSYTQKFERLDGLGEAAQRGVYGFVDSELGNTGGWAWRGYSRLGFAKEGALPISSYLGLGVTASRGEALQLGAALASAQLHDDARDIIVADGGVAASGELALELTARWQATDWLAVQPTFAWIKDPGGRSDLDSAVVAALRCELTW